MNAAREIAVLRRWPETYVGASVLRSPWFPRRRRRRVAGALERRLRCGGECAGDHDRARAGTSRARDQANRFAARPAAVASAAATRARAGQSRSRRPSNCRPSRRPNPQAVLPPAKPIEKLVEKKRQQKHASLASAPSTAEKKAERAAAPAPGASSHDSDARAELEIAAGCAARTRQALPAGSASARRTRRGATRLQRRSHRRRAHARIVRSSGSRLLDAATLALVERAAPLPPPPPEISGAQIAIQVPIRYDIR